MTKRKIFISVWLYLLVSLLLVFIFKETPYFDALMFFLLTLLIIYICRYANVITGLSNDNIKVKFLKKFTMSCLVGAMCVVTVAQYIDRAAITQLQKGQFLNVITCVFMLFIGNYAPKIPFNQYVGFRLPWTIKDEDTWRYAHRLFGKLSFVWSFFIMFLGIFIDSFKVITYGIGSLLIVCGLLSLIFYHRKMKGK